MGTVRCTPPNRVLPTTRDLAREAPPALSGPFSFGVDISISRGGTLSKFPKYPPPPKKKMNGEKISLSPPQLTPLYKSDALSSKLLSSPLASSTPSVGIISRISSGPVVGCRIEVHELLDLPVIRLTRSTMDSESSIFLTCRLTNL